jgi:hypothetical protein
MRRVLVMVSCAAAMAVCSAGFAQRTYQVNYTDAPPTIDAVRTAGEWDDAAAATGEFRLLRTADPGTLSTELITWQAVFDEDALYLIIESNKASFSGGTETGDEAVGFTEDLEIFFDPNRDGEANVGGDANDDSYQIQMALITGTAVRAAGAAGPPYLNTAARVNALFGDNVTVNAVAGWNPTQIAVARVVGTGAVVELSIPFNELKAEAVADSGLFLPEVGTSGKSHPANADTWIFNIARISSDAGNQLPLWNYHTGDAATAYFGERPHGEITFQGLPPSTNVWDFMLYQ